MIDFKTNFKINFKINFKLILKLILYTLRKRLIFNIFKIYI